jgi:hypothetical protein
LERKQGEQDGNETRTGSKKTWPGAEQENYTGGKACSVGDGKTRGGCPKLSDAQSDVKCTWRFKDARGIIIDLSRDSVR